MIVSYIISYFTLKVKCVFLKQKQKDPRICSEDPFQTIKYSFCYGLSGLDFSEIVALALAFAITLASAIAKIVIATVARSLRFFLIGNLLDDNCNNNGNSLNENDRADNLKGYGQGTLFFHFALLFSDTKYFLR